MDAQLLLGLLMLAPVLSVILLHASGVFTFLSLSLGSVLATYVAGDANTVLNSANNGGGLTTMQWVQLGLLVAPMLVAITLTRKKSKGVKLVLSATLALIAGALLALLATPYFSRGLQASVTSTQLWHQLDSLQTAIILSGTGLVMYNLFSTRWKPEKGGKKH